MRILVVGATAAAIKTALADGDIFGPDDTVEVLQPAEGTPQYDMVIGDNCVRVYANTIQFIRPFVKQAAEATKSKDAPIKKKAAPKKKKAAAPELSTIASTEGSVVPALPLDVAATVAGIEKIKADFAAMTSIQKAAT